MKLLTVITFSSTSIYILNIILLHVHIQKDKWWLLRPPFISSLWILDDPVDDQRLHVSVTCNAQQGQSKYLFWTLVFYFHLICMYYHLSTEQNLLYVITLSLTSISILKITLLFIFKKINGDYWDHLLSHPYEFQMTWLMMNLCIVVDHLQLSKKKVSILA